VKPHAVQDRVLERCGDHVGQHRAHDVDVEEVLLQRAEVRKEHKQDGEHDQDGVLDAP